MFRTSVVEKIKKNYVQQLFPDNRAVNEIMWKTASELERQQMKIHHDA
jgi:hypothetical protein